MKRVKITEAQFYRYLVKEESEKEINEAVPTVKPNDTIKEDVTELPDDSGVATGTIKEDEAEDIMESINKTQGGLQVRNLIKESTSIIGEYKSPYGQWNKITWNTDGTPVTSTNNYNKYIFTIDLPK